jgi:hypothetical protein
VRVELAAPFDGHEPNATIDIDDTTGRRLVSNGLARMAPDNDTPDESWSMAALRDRAATEGKTITGLRSKADFLAVLGDQTSAPNPAGNGEPEGATP